MDATFIGLLESQIKALKEAEPGADCNMIVLETVKLLLGNADLSAEVLSSYDKFGMRRIFAAYGEVGKKVCSFYESGKPFLDPSALNGTIGKTITDTSRQISETSTAFDDLALKEADLLAEESKLKALDEKYEALQRKVSELRSILETVSDTVIASLEDGNEQLESRIKKGKKKKVAVDEENANLRKLLADIEKVNTTVDAEQRRIKTNIVDVIDKHHDEIAAIYTGSTESLDEIKRDIERYIREFEALDASVAECASTRAFYETWLGENSTIIESMRKYGLESISQLSDAIKKAKDNAEYELQAYDMLIKKVVHAEEAAREAIERKQNKLVWIYHTL